MVAYIVAEDAWYVVPVAAFAPRTGLKLFPSGCKRKKSGLFEKYRDAWHLMKASPVTGISRTRKFWVTFFRDKCRRERPRSCGGEASSTEVD